jgi:hypothetical protein
MSAKSADTVHHLANQEAFNRAVEEIAASTHFCWTAW